MLMQADRSSFTSLILCSIFFITGIAALIFETLWFRLAGITFGNNVWSSAIVLSSFMGGMAAGNCFAAVWGDRTPDPLHLFACMGLIIASSGILLVIGFPYLTDWCAALFKPFVGNPAILNAIRLGTSFALLILPAAAMGATLPLLVRTLSSDATIYGNILGKLYGWNTLGACVGAIVGELIFVKAFGIMLTGIIAGAMILVVVMIVFRMPKINRPAPPPAAREPEKPSAAAPKLRSLSGPLTAVFVSGFILLSLEVLWFRFINLFVRGTSLAFAIMLAIVLAGIGLGALFVSLCYRYKIRLHRYVPQLALASGMASVAVYVFFANFSGLLGSEQYYVETSRIVLLSLFLMFPNSFLSGVIFTLIGELASREKLGASKVTGYLTMSNTLGSMLGPAVTGFILLPHLGMEKSFFGLSALYAMVAIFAYRKDRPFGRQYALQLMAAVFVLVFIIFPFGRMRSYLDAVSLRYRNLDGSQTVAIREEQSYTLQYLRKDFLEAPLYYRLLTNGYSMSSTTFQANRYMKLYVYLPVAIHPDLQDVLLISYGVGSTAKALTDDRHIARIDVVDISEGILDSSRIVFSQDRANPLLDARTEIHIEDGRFFLQTSRRRYDLITSEPPPPKMAGIVNLYTQEYFQLIHDCLKEGGIATYWLPVAQLNEPEAKAILKAFQNVFPDCTLWTGSGFEWMMVGTKHLRGRVALDHFRRQWDDENIAPELQALGFDTPEQIGTTFLMDIPDIRAYTRDAAPLTDNYPKRLTDERENRERNLPAYRAMMDTDLTRSRFENSAFINSIWPRALKTSTRAYFPLQNIINHELTGSNAALEPYATLEALTTQTSPKSPLYWFFNSDAFRQRLVLKNLDRFQENLPLFVYHLGVEAMADHDFLGAINYFSKFEDLDIVSIYLLCKSGDFQTAHKLAQKNARYFRTEKGLVSRQFLSAKFNLQVGD
jgi:spermidine synthase